MVLPIVFWTLVLVFIGLLGGWAPGFIFGSVPAAILFYIWLAIGVVMILVATVLWRRRRQRWGRSAIRGSELVCFALLIPLGYGLLPMLNRWGDGFFFSSHREEYQAVADSITSEQPEQGGWGEDAAGFFVIDVGPPVRVVFVRASWRGDWNGIVFDPADSLVEWQSHAARGELPLFGHALGGCTRREPHWFNCATLALPHFDAHPAAPGVKHPTDQPN